MAAALQCGDLLQLTVVGRVLEQVGQAAQPGAAMVAAVESHGSGGEFVVPIAVV